WAEKTKFGSKISAVVIAIACAFILSNLSIIPTDAPAYNIVWSYLVPLAIPLLLFKANLRKIIKEAGPTLIAFFFGAIGTIVGTFISFGIFSLGPEGWKLAGIFCSTYVGGSMNYVATAAALNLTAGDLLTAGVAADNLVMAAYFVLLFALPSFAILKKLFPTKHDEKANTIQDDVKVEDDKKPDLFNMMKGLAVGLAICAVGFGISDLINIQGSGILIITAIVVALATFLPNQIGTIEGADQVGAMLMQIFFVVIGASANISVVLRVGPILFFFAAVILFIHLLFILTAGKIFKLDLAEIVIASNANMGGPTTAAAMAVARKWKDLVIPAVLCGTLGYAIATFIGVAIGNMLR
ncbi:MAG: hypothetical protein COW08_05370, partial [Ignavibacteriales bacterium CG12_big_fil_rev_8_21_14_0_65_30_8]